MFECHSVSGILEKNAVKGKGPFYRVGRGIQWILCERSAGAERSSGAARARCRLVWARRDAALRRLLDALAPSRRDSAYHIPTVGRYLQLI